MNVIVVGGGIAGLTMALSLHQAGIRVRVCEAAEDVRPLGVGINCSRPRYASSPNLVWPSS